MRVGREFGLLLKCALLALPVLIWPFLEIVFPGVDRSYFLPFLNQIDVAYPISWMERLSQDSQVNDLALWEHRHDSGSPSGMMKGLPMIFGCILRLAGQGSYWIIVYLLHLFMIYGVFHWVRRSLSSDSVGLFVSTLWVFTVFLLGINVFYFQGDVRQWSLMFVYENFRAYPSMSALLMSVCSIAWLYRAHLSGRWSHFIVAGGVVALTPYGRPFDWMILTTFIGLMFLLQGFKQTGSRWMWLACMATNLVGASIFLYQYWVWSQGDLTVYHDSLHRGVLQGKGMVHFVKYGAMAGFSTLTCWFLMRNKLQKFEAQFFALLLLSSFLPYFQFMPSGKTISSFQYFFIYFSFPVIWLILLIWAAQYVTRVLKHPPSMRTALFGAVAVGLALQGSLYFTPDWMLSRIAFNRTHAELYRQLASEENAVVLSPNISAASSQELILRSRSWSFVPHPMMYTYAAMAPTSELLERQLLAKLLMTGTVADLEPLFAKHGLSEYDRFYESTSGGTRFWLDRLENCPARSYFVFDSRRSLKDFEVRHLTVPKDLLLDSQTFAYFDLIHRNVYHRVAALEPLPVGALLDVICRRFKLTHVLIIENKEEYNRRLSMYPERFVLACQCKDGSSLWKVIYK